MLHNKSDSENLFFVQKNNQIEENSNEEKNNEIEKNIVQTNLLLQKKKTSNFIKLKTSMKKVFIGMAFWKKFYKDKNITQNNNNKESKLEQLKKEEQKHFSREIDIYAHQKFSREFQTGLGFNFFF